MLVVGKNLCVVTYLHSVLSDMSLIHSDGFNSIETALNVEQNRDERRILVRIWRDLHANAH